MRTRRWCWLLILVATWSLAGCGARVDPKWEGLPPLADMPDSEQDAEIQRLAEQVEANPQSAAPKRALAAALAQRGRFEEAAVVLAEVLRRDPADDRAAAALLGLARLFSGAPPIVGRLSQAIVRDNPDNPGALWVLGELLLDGSQLGLARQSLGEAWEQGKKQWLVALALGRLAAVQADPDEAVDWLKQAEAVAPDTASAKLVLARVYLAAQDAARAVALARAAVEAAPTDPEARSVLGAALLASGRPQEAAGALERALELGGGPDPEEVLVPAAGAQRARWLLGRAKAELGSFEEARDLLEDAATRNWGPIPPPPGVNVDLAAVYQRLGNRRAAIEYYQRAIQADLDDADVYNNLAFLYAEEGDHLQEALELAQLAVDLAPSHVTYDTLGWVYYQSGKYPEAVEQLTKAATEQPDDPEIQRHLGLARSRLGGHGARPQAPPRSQPSSEATRNCRSRIC